MGCVILLFMHIIFSPVSEIWATVGEIQPKVNKSAPNNVVKKKGKKDVWIV